jgi:hypothetical protein
MVKYTIGMEKEAMGALTGFTESIFLLMIMPFLGLFDLLGIDTSK